MVRKRKSVSLNSPSTISTSSLAQLHEKLAALPRYTFDKEPVSICALPQLSTVSEVSETEDNRSGNSSLTTIRNRTYGVCQKKCNKASNISNEINKHSPIQNNNENSVSCLLMATIGSADESIISDIIERLPENIPCNTDNIVDLLAKEALQGNVAHKSDINIADKSIKDTKSLETLREKQIPNDQLHIDESSNEVVENTPLNGVEVITPPHRNRKNNLKSKVELGEKTNDSNLIHDVEAVENFFSQHFAENRNGDLIISPTLARKINQTSSESSDDVDLYIAPKNIVQDIALHQLSPPNVDVVECVTIIVDKVCQDLENRAKYVDSVDELKELKDNTTAKLTLKKRRVIKSTKEHENLNNIGQDNAPKQKGKSNQPYTLKFTTRKSVSSNTTFKKVDQPNKKQPFAIMSPIMERDSTADDTVTKNVDSLLNSPKCTTTPVLQRKRKLYSPKDETCHEKSNAFIIEATEGDTSSNLKLNTDSKTLKSNATCYKELEQERRKLIRRPRTRSLKKTETSPRTLKNNQIFDSIKDVVNGEPIKLADKTSFSKDFTVYNITSDSEDEYVKKKAKNNNTILKKVSNKVAGNSKTMTKTAKSRKKITVKTIQITGENKGEDAKYSRNLRKKKTITKNQKEIVANVACSKPYLEDELMRLSHPHESEILNTSLIIDGSKDLEKSVTEEEPAPILNVVPQIECITENDVKSDDNAQNIRNNNQPRNIPKKILSLKRNKKPPPKANLNKPESICMADNERTVSPLPGLVVETVLKTDMDVNDSVSVNMLQMFKDIYEGKKPVPESEVNTTHNLLSDTNEPVNYSPSNLNVTEEVNRTVEKRASEVNEEITENIIKKKKITKSTDVNKSSKMKLKQKFETVTSQVCEKVESVGHLVPNDDSEITMPTMGTSDSPITGHGDVDEDHPNCTMLNEHIEPRKVEQENFNQTLKDLFHKLTEQNAESSSENSSKNVEKTPSDRSSVKSSTNNSPVVRLTRLTPESINQISKGSYSIDNNELQTHKTVGSSEKTSEKNLESGNSIEELDKASKTQLENEKTRRSVISPIKLFDDMLCNNATTSTYARSESDDDRLKHIKTIIPSENQTTGKDSTGIETMENLSKKTVKTNIATSSPVSCTERALAECNTSGASGSSNTSKRMGGDTDGDSLVPPSSKRMKNDDNDIFGSRLIDTDMSMSSISKWLTRELSLNEVKFRSLLKTCVNVVMERVTTKMAEMYRMTRTSNWGETFMMSRADLRLMRETREQMFQETATQIMIKVVRVMETKFLELETILRSHENDILETVKRQAQEVIQDECKQNQVLLNILNEELQIMLDSIDRGGIAD